MLRSLLLALSIVGIASQSTPAQAASDELSLPKIGAKRRTILAEMRRHGLELVDGEDERMVFDGAPPGFPGVTQAIFYFQGVTLRQIELVFAVPDEDLAARDTFFSMRERLAERLGSPGFDRAKDLVGRRGNRMTLTLQGHTSTWTDATQKLTLTAEYGAARSLKLTVVQHVPFDEKLAIGEDGDDQMNSWAARELTPWATLVKVAADTLFDDFGEQRTVLQGATVKGQPVAVRLREVRIPSSLEGVERKLIESRFDMFTKGHWDVNATKKARAVDLDLDVEIVPVIVNGRSRYAMRLEAFTTRGKDRGQTIYSASHLLN